MNTKILKNIFIVIVVVVVGYFAYSYFFKSAPATSPASTSAISYSNGTASVSTAPNTVDAQLSIDTAFLSTLIGLNTIAIDPTLFSNPAFNSLKDNTVQIVNDGTVGRPNPFAPFDATLTPDNSTSLPTIMPNITPTSPNQTVFPQGGAVQTGQKNITIIPPKQ